MREYAFSTARRLIFHFLQTEGPRHEHIRPRCRINTCKSIALARCLTSCPCLPAFPTPETVAFAHTGNYNSRTCGGPGIDSMTP